MNKFIYLSSIGLIAISSQVTAVHADETAGEKVQNAAGDAKTNAKKDMSDDISNAANKADRKVSQ